MASQYTLTNDFSAITETQGTLYNVSDSAIELASASTTTKGQGILLRSGEKQTFRGTVYARSMDAAATLNVSDFTEGAGGGDQPVLRFCGTVSTYADLPASPEVGDVYNIETADAEHGILAGDNVAWDGTTWDRMAGVYTVMTGATSSTAGAAGLVPAPTAGQEDCILTGGGAWVDSIPTSVYIPGAFNKKETFTTSGSYTAPVTGVYRITLQGAGTYSSVRYSGGSGASGAHFVFYEKLTAGVSYSYTIGAGGSGGSAGSDSAVGGKGTSGGNTIMTINGTVYTSAGGGFGSSFKDADGNFGGVGGEPLIDGVLQNESGRGFCGLTGNAAGGSNSVPPTPGGGPGARHDGKQETGKTNYAGSGGCGGGIKSGVYGAGTDGAPGFVCFEYYDVNA